MAKKKIQRNLKSVRAPRSAASSRRAGIGALPVARKRGKVALTELIARGRRLQAETARVIREIRADAGEVAGMVAPVKARVKQHVENVAAEVVATLTRIRSRLDIPSKADVDELARRVAALSRQLKAAK